MDAIYVLLFLGALFFVALTSMFVLGSLIYLVSVGKEALQALSRICNTKAVSRVPIPVTQLGQAPAAVAPVVSVAAVYAYA